MLERLRRVWEFLVEIKKWIVINWAFILLLGWILIVGSIIFSSYMAGRTMVKLDRIIGKIALEHDKKIKRLYYKTYSIRHDQYEIMRRIKMPIPQVSIKKKYPKVEISRMRVPTYFEFIVDSLKKTRRFFQGKEL